MHSFKIALRNLRRDGLYSWINIVGLSVSLAVCSFIVLWIQDEKSYDRFHDNPEEIYIGVAHFKSDGGSNPVDITPGLLTKLAKQNYGEVKDYCRLLEYKVGFIEVDGKKTGEKQFIYADQSFFTFFNFPIIKGQQDNLLQNPNDVVISERLASELFGDDDPIGQTFKIRNKNDYHVVAVMKNTPKNTFLPQFDMVCSFKLLEESTFWADQFFIEVLNGWNGCEFLSFLRVEPGTDMNKLAKELTNEQTVMQDKRWFTFQPLIHMNLYDLNGEPTKEKSIRLFQWIALIILCMACINYINLVTARASKRQKGMIIRKILGADKKQLFFQLMFDAFALFIIATILALCINMALFPAYNDFLGKDLSYGWLWSNIGYIYGLMFVIIVVLAGIYPAWWLSSLKYAEKKTSGGLLRKALIIFQFIASFSLITGTIILESQMRYIRQKNLGFDKEQIITCHLYNMRLDVIKPILLQSSAVSGVTAGSENIMSVESGTLTEDWEGKIGEGIVSLTQLRVDTSFIDVMRIPLTEGTSFTSIHESQFILNESAILAMGMENPIGKRVGTYSSEGKIVGVAKDFNFESLHKTISPLIMYYRPSGSGATLYIRTNPNAQREAIRALEDLWKQYNPDYVFEYSFLDDSFDQIYQDDIHISRLYIIFSIVAIFISCLGLFGLVTYTAQVKTKEIAIRKVLGARISEIVKLLSKEFLVLVLIAMVIAFPLAWFLMNKFLQSFAYRVSIAWWMFLLAGLITLFLTLAAVSYQAIKAATANPVNAIKTE